MTYVPVLLYPLLEDQRLAGLVCSYVMMFELPVAAAFAQGYGGTGFLTMSIRLLVGLTFTFTL